MGDEQSNERSSNAVTPRQEAAKEVEQKRLEAAKAAEQRRIEDAKIAEQRRQKAARVAEQKRQEEAEAARAAEQRRQEEAREDEERRQQLIRTTGFPFGSQPSPSRLRLCWDSTVLLTSFTARPDSELPIARRPQAHECGSTKSRSGSRWPYVCTRLLR